MKIKIFCNPENGQIIYYIPTPDGQTVLIEPKIKREKDLEEGDPEEEEPKIH